MTEEVEKFRIEQELFNIVMSQNLRQIRDTQAKYDMIVAPARGGLIPGVMFSHALKCRMYPLIWSTRDYADRDNKLVPHEVLDYIEGKSGCKILLVEDIIDSGKTALQIIETIETFLAYTYKGADEYDPPQIDVAAIVTNIAQPLKVKFPGLLIDRTNDERWVEFWWEKGI